MGKKGGERVCTGLKRRAIVSFLDAASPRVNPKRAVDRAGFCKKGIGRGVETALLKRVTKGWFDRFKKLLHNLVSLLLTKLNCLGEAGAKAVNAL